MSQPWKSCNLHCSENFIFNNHLTHSMLSIVSKPICHLIQRAYAQLISVFSSTLKPKCWQVCLKYLLWLCFMRKHWTHLLGLKYMDNMFCVVTLIFPLFPWDTFKLISMFIDSRFFHYRGHKIAVLQIISKKRRKKKACWIQTIIKRRVTSSF